MEFPEVGVTRSARWRLVDFLNDASMELLEQELSAPGGRVTARWFTPPEVCGVWRIAHDQQRCLCQMYRADEVSLCAKTVGQKPAYVPRRVRSAKTISELFVYPPADCQHMVRCGLMRVTDPAVLEGGAMPMEVSLTVLGVVWGAFFDTNDDVTVCDRFLLARGFLLSEDKFPEAFGSQEDFDAALRESVSLRTAPSAHRARAERGIASMTDKFRRQVGL